MKLLKLIPILFIGLFFVSCGGNQTQNSTKIENSENSTIEPQKSISNSTQSKIDKWKNEKNSNSKRLSSKDFSKFDFSDFWEKQFDLGYIGNNYQRLVITFEKVTKIDSDEYSVVGFSQVKSNICKFKGKISNLTFNQIKLSDDDCQGFNYENANSRGFIIADFILEEDSNQKGSGVFMGILQSQWVIDLNGNIEQTFSECGDSERGDQFFGDWISYKGGAKFVAWGVYKIPFSEELDMGSSDFCPDERYINNGWEEFKR